MGCVCGWIGIVQIIINVIAGMAIGFVIGREF